MTHAQIIAIIALQFDADPGSITPDKHLTNDLGADSLDLWEILIALEEASTTDLSHIDVQDLHTVADVIAAVEGDA